MNSNIFEEDWRSSEGVNSPILGQVSRKTVKECGTFKQPETYQVGSVTCMVAEKGQLRNAMGDRHTEPCHYENEEIPCRLSFLVSV